MAIKHSKVSALADSGDTSKVRPSDWNAAHVTEGIFDVKDYGALGNNSADDTSAISSAISAAAAANGGIVWFRPGTYITQPLTIPPGVVLKGVNGQAYYNATSTVPNVNTLSRLKLKAGSTSALISPDDGGANLSTAVIISDLSLDCNGLTQPAINLPDQGSSISRFWRMERLYISNIGGTSGSAVYIGNQNTGCLMRECIIFNGTSGSRAGHDGVFWYGSDGQMVDCFIGYFGNVGLQVSGGANDEYFLMRGGGVFTCQTGIVVGGMGPVFVGVSVDHNQNDGVYCAYPASFIGCWFHTNSMQTNNQWSNINVDAATTVNITDCVAVAHTEGSNEPAYHIKAHASAVINAHGNYAHAGMTFGTAFTNYVGTISAPTFPASTVAVTNTTGADVQAFIANGTSDITAVVLGSTTTGLTITASTKASIRIPQGQKISFTYAGGTPTWTWVVG